MIIFLVGTQVVWQDKIWTVHSCNFMNRTLNLEREDEEANGVPWKDCFISN